MATAALTVRLLLVAVFAVAAVAKLADLPGSRRAVAAFGVPERLASAAGTLLPLAEPAIAAALVPAGSGPAGAAAALVLLVAFVLAVARSLRSGESPDCHCFGQLHSEPAGTGTLARNAALAAGAAFVLGAGGGRSLAAMRGGDAALLLCASAAGVLAVAASLLWRENRRLRAPGRSVPAVALDAGLPPGTPAPDVSVRDVDGADVTLGELLGGGRIAALVQVSPGCGPCRSLMPDLARWQRVLSERLAVIAVSEGELPDNRAFAREHGLSGLWVARGAEVREAFQVDPTPSAVLIGGDGRIVAAPATGAVAIEAMSRVALEREAVASG